MSRIAVAVMVVLATGCGRKHFDASTDGAPAGSDGGDADTSSLTASCQPAEPIFETPPAQPASEPTLYSNGLALIVRQAATLKQILRPAPGEPFLGEFAETNVIDDSISDSTFLELGEEVLAMGATNGVSPRELVYCPPPDNLTCQAVQVFTGEVEITDDIDGVSLAARDGQPFIVFNRASFAYVAFPRDESYLQWDAELIEIPGLDDLDDPSMSKNGELMMFFGSVDGQPGIYAMRFDDDARTFGELTAAVEDSPMTAVEIGVAGNGELELFGNGEQRGLTEPYRAVCTTNAAL